MVEKTDTFELPGRRHSAIVYYKIASSVTAVVAPSSSSLNNNVLDFGTKAIAMRFSLETIAEGLETDSEDVHGSASDVFARHLPPQLWKRVRKTEALLGLMATSCCLASKKRPDLFDPLSRIKASIRRKQTCLRRRALQNPSALSSSTSATTKTTTISPLTSASCRPPLVAVGQQQGRPVAAGADDANTNIKYIRALEFTCEFMERMCQRLSGYLCISQLETLAYDVVEQMANVVEDVGVLSYEIDSRQPMDDVMLQEIISTFMDMSLDLPHLVLEKFGRHFVHELKSKFNGDGAWLVLASTASPMITYTTNDSHHHQQQQQLEFSIWNVKDCYLWLRVGDERSYVIMHGLPGRKTKLPVCQSDLDFLLKDALTPPPPTASTTTGTKTNSHHHHYQRQAFPEPDTLRKHFENIYQGRWHCVRGEKGRFHVTSSKRLRHEARMCVDDVECVIWQW